MFDDALHVLGLALADNQRGVVVVDDDQVLEPDAGDGPAAGMDKDVAGIDQNGVLAVIRHAVADQF